MPEPAAIRDIVPRPPADPLSLARIRVEAAVEEYTRIIRALDMLSGVINTSCGPWVFCPQGPLPKKKEVAG